MARLFEMAFFPRSWAYYLEGHKLRRYEKQIAAAFDSCTLTTQGELEEFEKLQVDRPHNVIPNGVDGSYFHPNGGPAQGKPGYRVCRAHGLLPEYRRRVVFHRKHFPGHSGGRSKCRVSHCRIESVSGRAAVAPIPGVVVTGHVPDVRPFLKDAVVSVAPLRMARGTQNKILESMAIGIPVVTTPAAAKGIQATPGVHILVAEDPDRFAGQVVEVLKNPQLRLGFSNAGREQVNSAHVWSRSMEVLDNIFMETRI